MNSDPGQINPSLKEEASPKLKFPYNFPFGLLLTNLLQISRKILLNLLILHDFTRVLTASENFCIGESSKLQQFLHEVAL